MMSKQTTRKVSAQCAAEIHAGVERIYEEGKEQEGVVSELKLSAFLTEHKASEFGLAPVSKAMAVKMAVALEQRVEKWELEAKRLYGVGQDIEEMRVALEAKLKGRPSAEQFAIVLEDRRKAEERVEELEAEIGRIGDAMIAATKET